MFTSTLLVLAVVLVATQAKSLGSYYFLSSSDCEKITDHSKCAAAACSWCESGAVGSSCMSNQDAASLPSSVFTCTSSVTELAATGSTACEDIKNEDTCMSSSEGSQTCSWCTSGAVGASCMKHDDAAGLPSSVFQCTFQEAKGMSAGALLPGELSASSTGGSIGIDISQALSSSTASCFVSNGAGNYIIPRGYRSSGSVDPNTCASLTAAKTAGIPHRETYMFPCPTCSASAASQVSQLVSSMKKCSAFTGRIWLDIEGSQYWTGNTSNNRAWYQSLVDACKSSGYQCGVYSSASQWSAIFGSLSYAYGSNLPLWYAHYDGVASFSDFSSFGGWSKPFAKQYQGDVTLCSFGVDKNYSPNF